MATSSPANGTVSDTGVRHLWLRYGFTVRAAEMVPASVVALIVTVLLFVTGCVVTMNSTLAPPTGSVTLPTLGSATDAALLDSVTRIGSGPATHANATVP